MSNFLISQPKFSIISVSGENVATFLQGQLTTDVRTLSPNTFLPTALCQHQGKVVATGFVRQTSDTEAILIVPTSTQQIVIKILQPFAALSKITLHAHPPSNNKVYGMICKQTISGFPTELSHCVDMSPRVSVLCIHTKPLIYLCYAEPNDLAAWAAQLHDIDFSRSSAWQAQLIAAGLVFIESSCSSRFTPNMLGLVPSKAVSLHKGCYLGQEVIARTYHLGQVKRFLHTFFSDSLHIDLNTDTRLSLVGLQQQLTVVYAGHDGQNLWFQVVMPEHQGPFEFVVQSEDTSQSSPLHFQAKQHLFD